jgi:ribonuclease T1
MLKAAAPQAYRALLACALGAVFALAPLQSSARGPRHGDAAALDSIALADLPREGQATYALIRAGGPFPYPKDGVVFGNRERILSPYRRGYYREYTVRTPGSRDRGARRIICGGQEPSTPDACYYTRDHYASFRQIVE